MVQRRRIQSPVARATAALRIGPVVTKVNSDVTTASLMVWTGRPKTSTDETFKDLSLGDEFSFRGYTVKTTSIRAGNAKLLLYPG